MAKRLTDNKKWSDAWFMDLPSKYKLFWIYILDECNHAGIWEVNFKLASFYVGEHLENSECKRYLKDRIDFISDRYWYLKKFVEFQQNKKIDELNPKNNCHKSIIDNLLKHNIIQKENENNLGADEGLTSPYSNSNSNSNILLDIKSIDLWIKEISKSQMYLEGIYRLHKLKKGSASELLNTFKEHLKVYPKKHNNLSDFKKHFASWLQIKNNKKQLAKYQTHTKGQL